MNQKWNDFVCGWGAGCFETLILFPANKLIFRQQLHGVNVKDAIEQLKTEGIGRLYRGSLPPLLMRTASRSLMFGMFGSLNRSFECADRHSRQSMITCSALAAFCAGFGEAILCPFERVQVLLQSPKYHDYYANTGHALRELYKLGFRELYRGFSLVVFRNGFSNVLFFGLREPIRNAVISNYHDYRSQETVDRRFQRFPDIFADFISGAILGAFISTIVFPVNVVKQRVQNLVGNSFPSAHTVFGIVWNERNRSLRELFRGVHLNYTRSLLAWGIINASYEFLRHSSLAYA